MVRIASCDSPAGRSSSRKLCRFWKERPVAVCAESGALVIAKLLKLLS
jgi:hypothetical protein